jgi:O-antigen polymerase
MLEYPFYQAVVHWITFCCLIAFISSRQEIKRCYTIAAPVIMRSLAVIIFTLVTTYMAFAIQSLYWLEKYSVSPKLELLSNIWYPVEHGDIVLSAHMLQRLNDVNKVWNEKELLDHVDWLRNSIIYDPKDYLYKYMIRVLEALGQEEKAEQFRTEGKYLFPPSDF